MCKSGCNCVACQLRKAGFGPHKKLTQQEIDQLYKLAEGKGVGKW